MVVVGLQRGTGSVLDVLKPRRRIAQGTPELPLYLYPIATPFCSLKVAAILTFRIITFLLLLLIFPLTHVYLNRIVWLFHISYKWYNAINSYLSGLFAFILSLWYLFLMCSCSSLISISVDFIAWLCCNLFVHFITNGLFWLMGLSSFPVNELIMGKWWKGVKWFVSSFCLLWVVLS